MARHLKIKEGGVSSVHFDTGINDYTLCGLETKGDETISICAGVQVKSKVDCKDCIRIVNFCKQIEAKEYI